MDSKDIFIIVLICAIAILSAYTGYVAIQSMQTQSNTTDNLTNNSTTPLTNETAVQENESSNSASNSNSNSASKSDSSSSNNGVHREHLEGGDVAVDSNGRVVGHYYPNGEYVEGGQLGGMSIGEVRQYDDYLSKNGME